jgi:hypothetical protein
MEDPVISERLMTGSPVYTHLTLGLLEDLKVPVLGD